MKSFYTATAESGSAIFESVAAERQGLDDSKCRARVAVYDAPAAAPRVVDVEPCATVDYIEALSSTVYRLASEQGGQVPYSVVREISENFIHASFCEPVISIMDAGNTIRFADRGPGIPDKERAVLPGFTTATSSMKHYIRGVGSGLPLVRDFLSYSGGALSIEDNLGHGAVVTVTSGRHHVQPTVDARSAYTPTAWPSDFAAQQNAIPLLMERGDTEAVGAPPLTTRQKQVLALVMESGAAGPSLVSRELNVGVSTAYRDLASLEEMGLIEADGGKRSLTDRGLSYIDTLTSGF